MSLFMIDTGAVSASMSSIESLVSKFENLSSKIDGLDVSCDDDFNFAGAKSAIASNIAACSTKISNVSKTIENVVNAHTSLQGKLKFDGNTNNASQGSSSSSRSAVSYSSGGGTRSSNGGYSSSNGGGNYSASNNGGYNVSNSAGYNVSNNVGGYPSTSGSEVVIPSNGNSMFVDNSSVSLPIAGAGGVVAGASSLVLSDSLIQDISSNRYHNEDDKTMGIQETNEYYSGKVVQFNTGSGSNIWYAIQGATNKWQITDDTRLIAKKYGLGQLPEGAYETEAGLVIPGCSFILAPLVTSSDGIVGLPAKGPLSVMMPEGTAKPDLWKYGYSLYSKRGTKPYYGINEINSQKVADATLESALSSKITYDSTGYATIEGRYVISCDDYFGRVGDKVQVYTDTGPIECIIGYTGKEDSGRLNFFTNSDFDPLKLNDKVTLTNIKSINNLEYANGGWKDEYGLSADGHSSLLKESAGDSSNG